MERHCLLYCLVFFFPLLEVPAHDQACVTPIFRGAFLHPQPGSNLNNTATSEQTRERQGRRTPSASTLEQGTNTGSGEEGTRSQSREINLDLQGRFYQGCHSDKRGFLVREWGVSSYPMCLDSTADSCVSTKQAGQQDHGQFKDHLASHKG